MVAALLAFAALVGVFGSAVPAAGASDRVLHQESSVELDVEIGLAGVVPAGTPTPVRLTITSPRARVVSVEVNSEMSRQSMDVELGADAPTQVDLVISAGPWLEIALYDERGNELVNRTVDVETDPTRTLVGVGPSLATQGAPASSPTIGGIQDAVLVTLADDIWTRPGALASMSGVVLSAPDLDALTEAQQAQLREWIWTGGDLALDVEPRTDLPVVELPATGVTTAVGSGWVRFTHGAAAGGAWSTVLEPAVVRVSTAQNMFGPMSDSSMWDFFGLLSVGFLPTWVIALSVFGTALVAGPLAFYLLRSRRRRRLMWVVAPAVSVGVALALLVVGQSVFTQAEVHLMGQVRSSLWSTTGTVLSGLKDSTTLELGPDTQLLDSTPEAVVSGSGGVRTVTIDLPRNGFGSIGLSDAPLDDGPRIEVSAVATAQGQADVTVTNHSTGAFEDVTVTANGRTRPFASVGPGATQTLPFEMGSEIPAFGPVFPAPDQMNADIVSQMMGGLGTNVGQPESRGLVVISGTVRSTVSVQSLGGEGPMAVSSIVPVTATADQPAGLRIDQLGALSNAQVEQTQQMQGVDVVGGIVGGAPTTVVGVPSDPGGGGGGVAVDSGPFGLAPEYVRFSFPAGRPAGPCGVHSMTPELSAWNGIEWVPLEEVGDVYEDPRITGLEGQDSEMQDWMFPAVEPGARLHLRITGRALSTPPVLLFDCAGRP